MTVIYTVGMFILAGVLLFFWWLIYPDGPAYLGGAAFIFALWLFTMIRWALYNGDRK